MTWQTLGNYEYQFDSSGYTGWYRCVKGQMADGTWPMWNYKHNK